MFTQRTFPDQETETWVWDGLALIPYGEHLQTYIFSYCNYVAATACWHSSDPAGYLDDINSRFYASVPTYSLDLLKR